MFSVAQQLTRVAILFIFTFWQYSLQFISNIKQLKLFIRGKSFCVKLAPDFHFGNKCICSKYNWDSNWLTGLWINLILYSKEPSDLNAWIKFKVTSINLGIWEIWWIWDIIEMKCLIDVHHVWKTMYQCFLTIWQHGCVFFWIRCMETSASYGLIMQSKLSI